MGFVLQQKGNKEQTKKESRETRNESTMHLFALEIIYIYIDASNLKCFFTTLPTTTTTPPQSEDQVECGLMLNIVIR